MLVLLYLSCKLVINENLSVQIPITETRDTSLNQPPSDLDISSPTTSIYQTSIPPILCISSKPIRPPFIQSYNPTLRSTSASFFDRILSLPALKMSSDLWYAWPLCFPSSLSRSLAVDFSEAVLDSHDLEIPFQRSYQLIYMLVVVPYMLSVSHRATFAVPPAKLWR